jgi:hypothetical protein
VSPDIRSVVSKGYLRDIQNKITSVSWLCLCLCLRVCASYRNIVQLHSKLGISTPHYPTNSQLPNSPPQKTQIYSQPSILISEGKEYLISDDLTYLHAAASTKPTISQRCPSAPISSHSYRSLWLTYWLLPTPITSHDPIPPRK